MNFGKNLVFLHLYGWCSKFHMKTRVAKTELFFLLCDYFENVITYHEIFMVFINCVLSLFQFVTYKWLFRRENDIS